MSSVLEPTWWEQYDEARGDRREAIRDAITPRLRLPKPYVRLTPTPKQAILIALKAREIFFGGAAGPGKSTGLLMAALRYVDVPGYSALLLRRTFAELKEQGALIPKSHELLDGTPAVWNSNDKKWTFPSGAVLKFGYMRHETDVGQYQSAEYHFVGWDELTYFTEFQYTYVFSRQRRPAYSAHLGRSPDGLTAADVPLQTASASNPGGPGHDWVKKRFITTESREPAAVFIPAVMSENEHLDQAGYRKSLGYLRGATFARLARGDWDARDDGEFFTRKTWVGVEKWDRGDRRCRAWDLAGSKISAGNMNPDRTAGVRLSIDESEGEFCVDSVLRGAWSPGEVEDIIFQTAHGDGRDTVIRLPQDPGQAGKDQAERYRRHILRGFATVILPVSGKKTLRATPVSSAAEHKLMFYKYAPWNEEFFSELEGFPVGHDDQVDALSDAYTYLSGNEPGSISNPNDEDGGPVEDGAGDDAVSSPVNTEMPRPYH